MMNPVVHFELPAEDQNRMADFYERTFGWKMERMGPEMGNYILVQTSEVGEDGFPKQRGMINGGLYQRTEETKSDVPSVVISVPDIQAHVKKVAEAGGNVIGEPMDIPGVGTYVSFIDTEGNKLSMLQPSMMGGQS